MKFIEVDQRMPLVEGEVPRSYGIGPNGKLCEIVWEPSDVYPDPYDGEVPETDTYFLDGKEEYWGFETVCKACKTRFMAFDGNIWNKCNHVRNFCPGCGKMLLRMEAEK